MNQLANKGQGLLQAMARLAFFPASFFAKWQLKVIQKDFDAFWGFSNTPISFKQHEKFSTFTLGKPKSLWTYYFPNKEAVSRLKLYYSAKAFYVPTSNSSALCAMRFKYIGPKKNSHRTLIVFNGNGSLYSFGVHAWLFDLFLKAKDTSYDIIMYDHRSSGKSKGLVTGDALIDDGLKLFEYVNKTFQKDKDSIDLYGFSLGGAVATLVKSKLPETKGALINHRSFSSLNSAAKQFLVQNKLHLFLGLASLITKKGKWNLAPEKVWDQIQCRKLIISHKLDPVINYKASMSEAIKDPDCMNLKQKDQTLRIKNHHVQPLSFYNDQFGNDAKTKVLEFLLNLSKSPS